MTIPADNRAVIEELNTLIRKFSKGWHEGIEIDASDIALLCECGSELGSLSQQLTSEREKVKRLVEFIEGICIDSRSVANAAEQLLTELGEG